MSIVYDRGLITKKAWGVKVVWGGKLTVRGERKAFSRGRYEVLYDDYRGVRVAEIKGSLAKARGAMRAIKDIKQEIGLLNGVAEAIRDS